MTFTLKEERVSIKIRAYANRREQGVILMPTFPYNFFSIEQLVHKLLKKITRFLVSFIKILVLLKTCSKKTIFCH